jgi:hypothetical protein
MSLAIMSLRLACLLSTSTFLNLVKVLSTSEALALCGNIYLSRSLRRFGCSGHEAAFIGGNWSVLAWLNCGRSGADHFDRTFEV